MFYKISLFILLMFSAPIMAQTDSELSDGKSFSVLVTGNGPDVVLIPGLSTPRDVWTPLRAKLSKTHRLHIVQIRGFGDDPKSNADDLADGETLLGNFIFELADYIGDEITDKGRDAPAVIGHSLGGLSAMMIAARYPQEVSKIMVVDSLPFFGLLFGPTMTADAMKPQAGFLRDAIASAPAGIDERSLVVQSINDAGRTQVTAWAKTAHPKVTARLFYDVATTDIRGELPAIKSPITMLYPVDVTVMPKTRADVIYSGAFSAAQTAKLVPVMNSRHFIMLDQTQVFEQEVLKFLNI